MDAKLTPASSKPTRWAASVVLLGLLMAAGVKAASVAYSYDFVGRVTTTASSGSRLPLRRDLCNLCGTPLIVLRPARRRHLDATGPSVELPVKWVLGV